MSPCELCGGNYQQEEVLSDGSPYHEDCLETLKSAVEKISSRASALVQEIERTKIAGRQLEHESSRHQPARVRAGLPTPWRRRRRLAIAQRELALKTRVDRLPGLRDELATSIAELSEKHDALTAIYDRWLTYPPDWDERREAARESGFGKCFLCADEGGLLHVHHRKPISQGGNHRADNLQLLCESCHSQQHGGKTFRYKPGGGNIGAFAKRMTTIENAIASGACVTFGYNNYEREKSTRTIRPYRFVKKGAADNLCVQGYCYLRKEERIFRVSRMRGVKETAAPEP